jgi:O-acetylhomoserine/O-acetylserine sulfhydrylase
VSTKYLNRNYGGALYFTLKSSEDYFALITKKFKLVSPSGRYVKIAQDGAQA